MDQNKLIQHTEILGDNAQELPDDLRKIVDAMHEYLGQEKISDPKEFVTLVLLISGIMDVDEKDFIRSISRMNKVIAHSMMKRMANQNLH